jgi:hypothetical protein
MTLSFIRARAGSVFLLMDLYQAARAFPRDTVVKVLDLIGWVIILQGGESLPFNAPDPPMVGASRIV